MLKKAFKAVLTFLNNLNHGTFKSHLVHPNYILCFVKGWGVGLLKICTNSKELLLTS